MQGIAHLAPGHHTPVNSSRFNKARRPFGDPVSPTKTTPRFIPPPFTNLQNLVLPLEVVLRSTAEEKRIQDAGKLVFHVVGDTGGVHGTTAQEAVAVRDGVPDPDGSRAPDRPAFFYHLGDVVYFNGLSNLYNAQFYDPYKYYPAPIFAIPGNHDGDTKAQKSDEPDDESTLTGFIENFCASQPQHLDTYRETMTQPYVYWTLEAPFATIIGLYSNVDGSLDGRGTNEQQRWFEGQLRAAPADKCLIVAVHHPPYSLDADHGGSPAILAALDARGQLPPVDGPTRSSRVTSTTTSASPASKAAGRSPSWSPGPAVMPTTPSRCTSSSSIANRQAHPRRETVPDHRRRRRPRNLRRVEPRLPSTDG